jgi:hypothetical protein
MRNLSSFWFGILEFFLAGGRHTVLGIESRASPLLVLYHLSHVQSPPPRRYSYAIKLISKNPFLKEKGFYL